MLVKVSLFNLQGARSIRGTGVILASTAPFVNTFFHFFQIIFQSQIETNPSINVIIGKPFHFGGISLGFPTY